MKRKQPWTLDEKIMVGVPALFLMGFGVFSWQEGRSTMIALPSAIAHSDPADGITDINQIEFSPDSERLAVVHWGANGGEATLFDSQTGERLDAADAHRRSGDSRCLLDVGWRLPRRNLQRWRGRQNQNQDRDPKKYDRSKAARFTFAGPRNPLFDDATTQIGIDQTVVGVFYNSPQLFIVYALTLGETRERSVFKYPHLKSVPADNRHLAAAVARLAVAAQRAALEPGFWDRFAVGFAAPPC